MSTYTYVADATTSEALIRRAMAAYYRAEAGRLAPIPSSDSHLCELDGKRYVVLRIDIGVLAVYRVRNNGTLKGLRRWPRELEAAS